MKTMSYKIIWKRHNLWDVYRSKESENVSVIHNAASAIEAEEIFDRKQPAPRIILSISKFLTA